MQFTQPTSINETRTHYKYVCQQIEIQVPRATKLHKIKSSVILDKKNIIHHIFIYVCWGGFSKSDGNRVGEAPYDCDVAESTCTQIGNWAIGPHDECLPPNIGHEFDYTGRDNIVIKVEAHYDNTLGIPQQDRSGVQVTFTPELRPLNTGTTALGMDVINKDFLIPPQEKEYPLVSICPSEATSKLKHPIYIYQFYPHMHLHGRSMFTEHYRCGKKIGEMAHVEPFEFDNQQQFRTGSKSIKILPGKAMVTTCKYTTMDLNETLYAGLGTNDEMCVSFMSFYFSLPDEGMLRACFSFENRVEFDRISLDGGTAGPSTPEGGDDFPSDHAALVALLSGRFALTSSIPTDGILTNFLVIRQLVGPLVVRQIRAIQLSKARSDRLALSMDCESGLFCDEGLCAETGSSNASRPTQALFAVFSALALTM